MNKWLLKSVLAVGAIVGVWMVLAVGQAQASLIDPPHLGDDTYNDAEADIEAILRVDLGLLDEDEMPGEFDVGYSELEGYLEFKITNKEDPGEAQVQWDLTGSGWEAWAVVVKDGNVRKNDITWLWYEVSATPGDYQRITGEGLVSTAANGNGAISNIRLYGVHVPDASAVFLLGSACLMGFAAMRKKPKK